MSALIVSSSVTITPSQVKRLVLQMPRAAQRELLAWMKERLEPRLPQAELTRKQLAVVRLTGAGLSGKEIALQLSIGEKTVINHKTQIFKRLGLHNSLELVRYAIARGLVNSDMENWHAT